MTALKRTISDQENTATKTPVDFEEAIRRRAYDFYEQRGYIDGYDMEDWLLAEQEFRGKQRKTGAT